MEKIKVLIVEDDQQIGKALKDALEKWDMDVQLIQDFGEVLQEFIEAAPQLVLMDIILPYYNGYYWCTKIREISNVPMMFISSKSEKMDMVMAMQLGGDDYIKKPIDLTLTIAKIQALLRRSYDFIQDVQVLQYRQVQLHLDQAEIRYANERIPLTKTECQIMQALFRAKGAYVSREKIMEKCWHGESYIDDNTLAVNMTRLRKKLREIKLDDFIVTKKRFGYALKPEA